MKTDFMLHPYCWWSELESNQPLGFFGPMLIRLSYPTQGIANCQFLIIHGKHDFLFHRQLAFGNRQCC